MIKNHNLRLFCLESDFVEMPSNCLLINIIKPLWPDILRKKKEKYTNNIIIGLLKSHNPSFLSITKVNQEVGKVK